MRRTQRRDTLWWEVYAFMRTLTTIIILLLILRIEKAESDKIPFGERCAYAQTNVINSQNYLSRHRIIIIIYILPRQKTSNYDHVFLIFCVTRCMKMTSSVNKFVRVKRCAKQYFRHQLQSLEIIGFDRNSNFPCTVWLLEKSTEERNRLAYAIMVFDMSNISSMYYKQYVFHISIFLN